MNPHVDFITFATADLDAARAFYVTGLGWTPTLDIPGEIIFFQLGPGLILGLYDAGKFAMDLGELASAVSGVALSHNVTTPEDVDAVISAAARAGATVVKAPAPAAFGGYHGYFADPNGVTWEVAHNPGWRVDEDGTVRFGE